MHIAYYISSHGYGHGVRSSAVCNCFSSHVQLTIRSSLPRQFFDEEIVRPFSFHPGRFDCGCIQSDGVTVDIDATLDTYRTIADENERILDKEVAWCHENEITGIVSDIASFPFAIASKAGLPSIGVSNFSWHDIYTPYLQDHPTFAPCLEKIDEQYSQAGLLLALVPANAMSSFRNKREMPIVARPGTNRQDEIRALYTIASDKKIGLIYTGNFGLDTVQWHLLEQFKQWEFIGVYPLPGEPANFHLVSKEDFRYQDLSASVDCMISKIGYGVYSECLSNGVPLIYVPRTDFAEHPFLENAIKRWGHGYRCNHDDFYSLHWEQQLTEIENRVPPVPLETNGAETCAQAIETYISTGEPI